MNSLNTQSTSTLLLGTTDDPDGDIILRSLQGVLFRLHSYTLRTTSGLFRTIFTLPQPRNGASSTTNSSSSTPVIIPIYEPTSLLTQFLPLITGRPPPKPLHTLDLATLTHLLVLAEKWDAPGPIAYIRNVINGSHFIDHHHHYGSSSSSSSNAIYFPYSPFPSLFQPLSLSRRASSAEDGLDDDDDTFEDAPGDPDNDDDETMSPLSSSASASSSTTSTDDKLEMLGPLTGFFRTDPIRVYVLAKHFRWRAEAERAAVSLLALSEEELERRWVDVREGRSHCGEYFFEEEDEGEEGGEEEESKREDEEPAEKARDSSSVDGAKDATMFMVTNQAWDSLVELRKRRCGRFKELVDSQERFTAGNNSNYTCIRCSTNLDNSSWHELKRVMIAELESRPLGDTLLAAMSVPAGLDSRPDSGTSGVTATANATANTTTATTTTAPTTTTITTTMPTPTPVRRRTEGESWPELASCFKARCPTRGCGAANYDPLATIKQIRKCVQELPWRVAWDECVDG